MSVACHIEAYNRVSGFILKEKGGLREQSSLIYSRNNIDIFYLKVCIAVWIKKKYECTSLTRKIRFTGNTIYMYYLIKLI